MKKALNHGDLAPTIDTADIWERTIHVPSKDKWIYLSFHRFAACPFCNLRTNELIHHYEKFKGNNIEIVSIWPSSKEILITHAGSEKSPFPMLSDKNKSVYKSYGVTESSFVGAMRLMLHPKLMFKAMKNIDKKMKIDEDPKLMPASFLIDPDGVIKMVHYGKHYGDHPTIETILDRKI